jgi:hypothetical protein
VAAGIKELRGRGVEQNGIILTALQVIAKHDSYAFSA